MTTFSLHHGDCREVLATLAADSLDACVCDPPYGLSFMNRHWDYDVPSIAIWREVFRVLKPGAHLLAFFGSRTYHRGVVQIEDAGFEIRDQIMWVYGSGFPKSLDVSKAIDKARTEDVEPVRVVCRAIRAAMDARGLKSRDLVQHFDNCHTRLIDHWAARDTDSQPFLPTWAQWEKLRDLLSMGNELDAEVARLNDRKGSPSDDYEQRPDAEHSSAPGMRESWTDGKGWTGKTAKGGEGIREAARAWEGWGTALKPAHEPIVVARKPLVGTVAANVQAFGTGALNIDGCRIGFQSEADKESARPVSLPKSHDGFGVAFKNGDRSQVDPKDKQSTLGRFPANLIHDGSAEVLERFPFTESNKRNPDTCGGKIKNATNWNPGNSVYENTYSDSGSAARFFYCAKASKADRDEGNSHPTVKPTDLMRYLCRLVTPPGGTVLDCFAGSGSTGKAAMLEGFHFVGIEREAEYIEIARARIEAARHAVEEAERERVPSLFD